MASASRSALPPASSGSLPNFKTVRAKSSEVPHYPTGDRFETRSSAQFAVRQAWPFLPPRPQRDVRNKLPGSAIVIDFDEIAMAPSVGATGGLVIQTVAIGAAAIGTYQAFQDLRALPHDLHELDARCDDFKQTLAPDAASLNPQYPKSVTKNAERGAASVKRQRVVRLRKGLLNIPSCIGAFCMGSSVLVSLPLLCLSPAAAGPLMAIAIPLMTIYALGTATLAGLDLAHLRRRQAGLKETDSAGEAAHHYLRLQQRCCRWIVATSLGMATGVLWTALAGPQGLLLMLPSVLALCWMNYQRDLLTDAATPAAKEQVVLGSRRRLAQRVAHARADKEVLRKTCQRYRGLSWWRGVFARWFNSPSITPPASEVGLNLVRMLIANEREDRCAEVALLGNKAKKFAPLSTRRLALEAHVARHREVILQLDGCLKALHDSNMSADWQIATALDFLAERDLFAGLALKVYHDPLLRPYLNASPPERSLSLELLQIKELLLTAPPAYQGQVKERLWHHMVDVLLNEGLAATQESERLLLDMYIGSV